MCGIGGRPPFRASQSLSLAPWNGWCLNGLLQGLRPSATSARVARRIHDHQRGEELVQTHADRLPQPWRSCGSPPLAPPEARSCHSHTCESHVSVTFMFVPCVRDTHTCVCVWFPRQVSTGGGGTRVRAPSARGGAGVAAGGLPPVSGSSGPGNGNGNGNGALSPPTSRHTGTHKTRHSVKLFPRVGIVRRDVKQAAILAPSQTGPCLMRVVSKCTSGLAFTCWTHHQRQWSPMHRYMLDPHTLDSHTIPLGVPAKTDCTPVN